MLEFLKLNRWSGNKAVQNFFFLSFIQASNILISIVTIPIIVKAVDIEQFGLISLSLSIITLFNVGVSYGFHLSGPREVAVLTGDNHKLSKIFSTTLFTKILLAVFFTVTILLLINTSALFERFGILLAFSTILLLSEALFPSWFAQGMQRMSLISIGNLLSKLLYLLLLIQFVIYPNDSKWVNFFNGAAAVVINTCLIGYIIIKWKIKIYLSAFNRVWITLKTNFILFLSALISHISISSGVIILSFFADNRELGLYSLAERIMFVLRMFPVLIIQSIYPNASKLYKEDVLYFYKFLRKYYLVTMACTLIISITAFITAPWIILLLSGEYREGSINMLRILAFIPFFSSINVANMILVLVSGNNKLLFKGTWIVALFLLLSGSLLSWQMGGQGLAYALLLTEMFIFIIQLTLNFRELSDDTRKFYSIAIGRHYNS